VSVWKRTQEKTHRSGAKYLAGGRIVNFKSRNANNFRAAFFECASCSRAAIFARYDHCAGRRAQKYGRQDRVWSIRGGRTAREAPTALRLCSNIDAGLRVFVPRSPQMTVRRASALIRPCPSIRRLGEGAECCLLAVRHTGAPLTQKSRQIEQRPERKDSDSIGTVLCLNWTKVHCSGFLSGRHRRIVVPCLNRPPVK
jgi:hypothetical protein